MKLTKFFPTEHNNIIENIIISTQIKAISFLDSFNLFLNLILNTPGHIIINIGHNKLLNKDITDINCFTNKENPKQTHTHININIFRLLSLSLLSFPYINSMKFSAIAWVLNVIPNIKNDIAPNYTIVINISLSFPNGGLNKTKSGVNLPKEIYPAQAVVIYKNTGKY